MVGVALNTVGARAAPKTDAVAGAATTAAGAVTAKACVANCATLAAVALPGGAVPNAGSDKAVLGGGSAGMAAGCGKEGTVEKAESPNATVGLGAATGKASGAGYVAALADGTNGTGDSVGDAALAETSRLLKPVLASLQ